MVDAYRDVSRAESDRQRRINEGNTYLGRVLEEARGQSASIVNRAEADRAGRLARASGEADAFTYRAEARAPYPALTDHRLYWESVASVLAGKTKVVLDPDKTRHRHLIVPNFPLGAGASAVSAATAPLPRPEAP